MSFSGYSQRLEKSEGEMKREEKEEDLFLEQKKMLMKTRKRRLKQRKYQVYKKNLIKGTIG